MQQSVFSTDITHQDENVLLKTITNAKVSFFV
ncbi:Uncharacterised protein [Capnocytophaga ochracea]|uniref:Uncharacterized protein n=1 Tax=Capnocytophaga ochracea TaxID=1018 RepID=A0A7Z8YFK2_CAPOC|nr:Uncharacterised protein [Capnocytophaga ochracea]